MHYTKVIFYGCKKLDIERIAAVNTESVENITSNQAKAYGTIIDLGQSELVSDYGFCWAINKTPTIDDASISYGSTSIMGGYYDNIIGLSGTTNYSLRAYVTERGITSYGNTIEFKTESGTPPPVSKWFNYDDGFNFDGIGLTDGGNFDLAIRIPTSDLQSYNGFYVSKFRFFVKIGDPVEYNVTVWEGSGTPDLIYTEGVPNYNVEAWTEYIPTQQYVINSSQELWVGLWVVNHAAGTYPAGVDDGPAIAGKGDMLSFDDGDTWETLSGVGLDYNWNMQVYVTNNAGQEKQLVINKPKIRERKTANEQTVLGNQIASKKQNNNLDR